MRAIGRALDEMIGVLAAGFVGFFVMLAYVVGSLIWFTCGVASFCFLLVALFSMVMWVFTHDKHAFHVMLGYFVYAGVAYAGIAAISHYQARLTKLVRNRRGRAARGRVGWRKTRQLGADSSPLRRSAQARNLSKPKFQPRPALPSCLPPCHHMQAAAPLGSRTPTGAGR